MLLIDLENNYYSTPSLYAIVIQISIMMLDRLLYVKGWLFGKIAFHCLFCLGCIFFCFLYIPSATQIEFGSNPSLIYFMLVQMVYIFVSSLQIRHGFPTSDNFIADSINRTFSILNRCMFFVLLATCCDG